MLVSLSTLLQPPSHLLAWHGTRRIEADLEGFEVPSDTLDFVPESVARENVMLPIGFRGRTLVLAVQDPQDVTTLEAGVHLKPGHRADRGPRRADHPGDQPVNKGPLHAESVTGDSLLSYPPALTFPRSEPSIRRGKRRHSGSQTGQPDHRGGRRSAGCSRFASSRRILSDSLRD